MSSSRAKNGISYRAMSFDYDMGRKESEQTPIDFDAWELFTTGSVESGRLIEFFWGAGDPHLGVVVINRHDGSGMQVKKVDATGSAIRNNVCEGDRLVAINGRFIPEDLADSDLGKVFNSLAHPIKVTFFSTAPDPAGIFDAWAVSASPRKPTTAPATHGRVAPPSPRVAQMASKPRHPPARPAPAEAPAFDLSAVSFFSGSSGGASSPPTFKAGDAVSFGEDGLSLDGVVRLVQPEAKTCTVWLAQSGRAMPGVPLRALRPLDRDAPWDPPGLKAKAAAAGALGSSPPAPPSPPQKAASPRGLRSLPPESPGSPSSYQRGPPSPRAPQVYRGSEASGRPPTAPPSTHHPLPPPPPSTLQQEESASSFDPFASPTGAATARKQFGSSAAAEAADFLAADWEVPAAAEGGPHAGVGLGLDAKFDLAEDVTVDAETASAAGSAADSAAWDDESLGGGGGRGGRHDDFAVGGLPWPSARSHTDAGGGGGGGGGGGRSLRPIPSGHAQEWPSELPAELPAALPPRLPPAAASAVPAAVAVDPFSPRGSNPFSPRGGYGANLAPPSPGKTLFLSALSSDMGGLGLGDKKAASPRSPAAAAVTSFNPFASPSPRAAAAKAKATAAAAKRDTSPRLKVANLQTFADLFE